MVKTFLKNSLTQSLLSLPQLSWGLPACHVLHTPLAHQALHFLAKKRSTGIRLAQTTNTHCLLLVADELTGDNAPVETTDSIAFTREFTWSISEQEMM